MSVRWDALSNRFYVLPEAQLTLEKQFQQICMAARSELGIDLRINSETAFDNLPDDLVKSIVAAASRG